jgi:hypothetical protein
VTTPPPEPTSDEVVLGATVNLPDGRWARACWFPSIGGYVGKALVIPSQVEGECCTEVWVWHNGQFPFSGQCPACSSECSPVLLHVHGGQDFIAFGELVDECESATGTDGHAP